MDIKHIMTMIVISLSSYIAVTIFDELYRWLKPIVKEKLRKRGGKDS